MAILHAAAGFDILILRLITIGLIVILVQAGSRISCTVLLATTATTATTTTATRTALVGRACCRCGVLGFVTCTAGFSIGFHLDRRHCGQLGRGLVYRCRLGCLAFVVVGAALTILAGLLGGLRRLLAGTLFFALLRLGLRILLAPAVLLAGLRFAGVGLVLLTLTLLRFLARFLARLASFVAVLAPAALRAILARLFARLGLLGALFGGGGWRGRRCRGALEQTHDARDQALGVGRHWRCRYWCRAWCLNFLFHLLANRGRGGRLDRRHCRRRRNIEVGFGQRHHLDLTRRAALVARLRGLFVELVFAQACDIEVRGFQLRISNDHHRHIVSGLDFAQAAALFIEQEVGDFVRRLHQDLSGVVLHRVLFAQTQDRQGQRFYRAQTAVTVAARADILGRFAEAGTQPLA